MRLKTCLGSRSDFSMLTSQPMDWNYWMTCPCQLPSFGVAAFPNQLFRNLCNCIPCPCTMAFTSETNFGNRQDAGEDRRVESWIDRPDSWKTPASIFWMNGHMQLGFLHIDWESPPPLEKGSPDGIHRLHLEYLTLELSVQNTQIDNGAPLASFLHH